MEEQGIIDGYTLRQKSLQRHFVTVFMETNDFDSFEAFVSRESVVEQAYKVTGEGCYMLIVQTEPKTLEEFLNRLLRYARYRVATALRCFKG